MKKRNLWLMGFFLVGSLFIGVDLFAANGDLIVNGNVGIGTTSPIKKLDVNGDIRVGTGILSSGQRSNFYLALQGDRNMVLYDNGVAVWASNTGTSDIRLKKNVRPLTDVLPQVMQLKGVRFNWIDESWGSQTEIGIIAQEMEKYFPELVTTDKKSGYKLVQYEKLTPVLLEAIKELKAENNAYAEKLSILETKIAQIEKSIEGK